MERDRMIMTKLSVIVPVYNVEPYIEKCLESLVNQTLEEIEILVVNDGSPDGSQTIIDQYVCQYPDKVYSLQKENGGLSDARNYGVARATGKYIGFVDGDDYADVHMYENMVAKAESKDYDMVVCDVNYIYEQDTDRRGQVSSHIEDDLLTKEEVKASMTVIYPVAWNKIYHRQIFDKGYEFKKKVWYEDVEFIHRIYPEIQRIGTIKEPYYRYLQRGNSITAVFDERLFDYVGNWESILEQYREKGLFEEYYNELQYCCMRYLYATLVKGAIKSKDRKIIQRARREVTQLVKANFQKPYKNKYFYQNGLKGLYILALSQVI